MSGLEYEPAETQIEEEIAKTTKTLAEYGISTENWGKDSAKTVRHLAIEILKGESRLESDPDTGKLIRHVAFVHVDVRYITEDRTELQLVEDEQIFHDRPKPKIRNQIGVSEKLTSGQTPLDAARFGLRSELGIQSDLNYSEPKTETFDDVSPTYPGLLNRKTKHAVQVYIGKDDYKPKYQEVQWDKTTNFSWREVKAI